MEFIHYPEEDDHRDCPKEPYIKLSATFKEHKTDGVLSDPVSETRPYYWAIGNGRYDMTSGTGVPAIMRLVEQRQRRGHVVLGYGNFPKGNKFYNQLIGDLQNGSSLSLTNPNSPLRKSLEEQLKKEAASKKGGKREQATAAAA